MKYSYTWHKSRLSCEKVKVWCRRPNKGGGDPLVRKNKVFSCFRYFIEQKSNKGGGDPLVRENKGENSRRAPFELARRPICERAAAQR